MISIYKFFKRLSVFRKVMLGILTLLVIGYIFCLPRQLFHVPYSTVVTDRNDELLGARIASDGQWRFLHARPHRRKSNNVSSHLKTSISITIGAFNPLSVGRAIYQNTKHKRIISGGSTLTMQTIRLARNESRTFGEKITK